MKLLTGPHRLYMYAKKASEVLGLLYENKNNYSKNVLIKLYKSMVMPIIEYGCVLYDDINAQLSNKLENIQRRAAVICSGALPRTETKRLLNDLGWISLKDRRSKFKLLYLYRIYVQGIPSYLNIDLHLLMGKQKVRETRQSEKK